MQQSISTKKLIAIVIGIIVVSIGFILAIQIPRLGKIEITFDTYPSDAKITVNGTSTGKTVYLEKGNYTYTVNREGFAEETGTLAVIDSNDTIYVALVANSDVGYKWEEEHSDEISEFESRVGASVMQAGAEQSEAYPLIDKLPIITPLYKIGYIADPSDPSGQAVIITINASEQYRQNAIFYLSGLGYDLSDYKFDYYNYESPFES